ncbi:MAG: hypothetical protein LBT59_10715, partial [Clostridiales bacterium]|nr:hypothetical protein [Clostridiales bacterium]
MSCKFRAIIVFIAMMAMLSGCSERKSSVGLWSESLDEMKNGSFSFYKRSAALSVPVGTYDYIDVIKEIEENEDWSDNLVIAMGADGAYRIIFFDKNVSSLQAERVSNYEWKIMFDSDSTEYKSPYGTSWTKAEDYDALHVYRNVRLSTVDLVSADGSVIRRKNTNSPFNVIVAYLKEATQSFQKRLLLGFYGEGNY